MNNVQKLLSINIKSARKKLDYSQLELATKCDVSPSFIAEIESGKKYPSAKKLQAIADGLGLKPYQLFLDSDKKQEFEKFNVLTNILKELKEKINIDMELIIKKYLK